MQFPVNPGLSCPAVLPIALRATVGPAHAQSPTITSNGTTFAGDCHGGDVFVKGDGNQGTLEGYCRDVTISGNSKRVRVEMTSSSSILVPGRGNKVDYRIPYGGLPPQNTVLGAGNEAQQNVGFSETPRSGVVEPRGVGRVRQ